MSKTEQDNKVINEATRIIYRRRILVLGVSLLGFSVSTLTAISLPPIYQSHAKLSFEKNETANIQSQIEWIKSPELINAVAQTIGKSTQSSEKIRKISEHITKDLQIEQVKQSQVIKLSYKDHSPYITADVVNTLAQLYLQKHTRTAVKEIDPKKKAFLELLQSQTRDAQEQLQAYLEHKSTQNNAPLITSYERAKQELQNTTSARKPFLAVDGTLILNPDAPAIKQSQIIKNLRDQQRQKETELDDLSIRYGYKYPKIVTLKEELSKIQSNIAFESHQIMSKVNEKYLTSLNTFEKLHHENNSINQAIQNDETLESLQKQAIENAQLLKRVTLNLENEQKVQSLPPAQIISLAPIPTQAIGPNKLKVIGFGALLSIIAGLLAAFIAEKTRHVFLSGRQLEEILNIPCYALIPKTNKDDGKILSDYVVDHPDSQLAEAVRSLRLTLKLRAESEQRESKVITLTSSVANEGKTTLASWVARLAAKSGERVILIDADLRRPSIHKYMQKENKHSLVEYLTDTEKLEDVIDKSDPSGLHMIYGRTIPGRALDLISGDKMDQLIRNLRKSYDLILIDSPASMAVADARALEKYSDQLLYVVAWNSTSREIVHNGISQFLNFKKDGIATVLTHIDLKKHSQFGYGSIFKHYGDYKEYAPI